MFKNLFLVADVLFSNTRYLVAEAINFLTAINNLLTSEQKVDVIASTNRISAMDSIVSVQEVSDDDGGDSGTKKRAHQILDRLEDVRMGLLMGQIPKSDLVALSDILTVAREKVVDSSLLELLDDIELRAKIELAKLDAIN